MRAGNTRAFSGLRVRASRGHAATRGAVCRFADWLRSNYDFPIRVSICLLPGPTFVTRDGKSVVASFWWPSTRGRQARIRIATGDYPELKAEHGRDGALAAILLSCTRQVLRYQQWVRTGTLDDRNIARRASALLGRYTVEMLSARPNSVTRGNSSPPPRFYR